MSKLQATAKNGDAWTSETQDGYFLYRDRYGNLYESSEEPAFRITMDNAGFGSTGIEPLNQEKRDSGPS